MTKWSDGPKRLGCVYHQRGVRKFGADSIVADVFVMPRIARRRPIAVTIGRYRNYKPITKVEWQLRQPEEAMNAAERFAELFGKVGVQFEIAAELADELRDFILREATVLKKTLAGLPKSAP